MKSLIIKVVILQVVRHLSLFMITLFQYIYIISIYIRFLFVILKMEGFEAYEERRKRKHDKQLDANVMIGSHGFDEGVDTHIDRN